MMLWIAFAAALLAQSAFAAGGAFGSQYVASGQCGPFSRAQVGVAKGMCLGVVAGPDKGLKMPRMIVEWRPGEFILTDMGGWVGANGRVLRMIVSKNGAASINTVFDKLRQPHGLALGPDGKVYLGEKGRVSRFDPSAPGSKMETVIDGLPEDGLHPLTNLIFLRDGALVVNIGAPTDRCGTKAKPEIPQTPCPESQGERARAALWKLTFDKPGGKIVRTEVFARGLRNSMALALDPQNGRLIQAENSVDLPGENEPVEELNLIEPGAHYGWPHCVDANQPLLSGVAKSSDCGAFKPAAVNLPPHAAPLGMVAYEGTTFPELKGKLVIGLHGYRKHGHRIVAIDLNVVTGRDANTALTNIVFGWDRKRGIRPQGAPVGVTVAADGSIWFVEDKNRTIMVLLRQSGTATDVMPSQPVLQNAPLPPKGWSEFASKVLKPKCATCHVEARKADPAGIWALMVEQGWAGEGALKDSKLARSLAGAGPEKPMPPPAGLKSDPLARAAFEKLLADNP